MTSAAQTVSPVKRHQLRVTVQQFREKVLLWERELLLIELRYTLR
jgi:hypothetical protein